MKISGMVIALAALLVSAPAFAEVKTVNLSVPGMDCPSCPFIIEAAIRDIEGVQSVQTNLAERTALVVYDDAVAELEDITYSTLFVGYESSVIPDGNG